MSASPLTARGVSVSFDGARCLDDVDLDLAPGRVRVVLGRSGAGKSTLVRVLAGVVAPERGVVRLEGRALAPEPGADFPAIGYVMQRPERQFFADTVGREVAFALERSGEPDGEVETRVRAALGGVGAGDASLARVPWSLSRGEQRLVAFASIRVFSPRVLLLDEPLAGLDPCAAGAVRAAIRQAATGGAAVLATGHEIASIGEVADDVSLLAGGRLSPVDLASDRDRESLVRAGFELPAAWVFLAARLGDFWTAGRWREPLGTLAKRLSQVVAEGPPGGR